MDQLVKCHIENRIAVVTMDDGKANALSPAMLAALTTALDQAETLADAVVLAGRSERFSGGFDLSLLREGGPEAFAMLRGGFDLSVRLLSFPKPVVIACTGHAVAMGAFLLLSADYRIGAAGPYRVAANEVAIGLTMPLPALALLQHRLDPSAFTRAALLAETFSPEQAVEAGFLDRVVAPAQVVAEACQIAIRLSSLDAGAHSQTKLRARSQLLEAVRSGIGADFGSADAGA
ncbi:MAG: crotonase/enoyl-CoA hydratase family protein [Candidatus Binatia bacterium]